MLSGKIEIIKGGAEGGAKLGEVGPGGVFGEMGLISEDGVRSATARAVERTELLEVRNNPVRMLAEMGDVYAALALLKQVICVLGEWLRAQNSRVVGEGEKTPAPVEYHAQEAAGIIKANLPKGLLKFFPAEEQLADGQFLCREGDQSRGFFFIHKGTLDVLKADAQEEASHVIGHMHAPTVAGEVAYFSGQPRLASLRAAGEVTFTRFSGYDFEILKEEQPEKALEVLLAAARCIVSLLTARNSLMAGGS